MNLVETRRVSIVVANGGAAPPPPQPPLPNPPSPTSPPQPPLPNPPPLLLLSRTKRGSKPVNLVEPKSEASEARSPASSVALKYEASAVSGFC